MVHARLVITLIHNISYMDKTGNAQPCLPHAPGRWNKYRGGPDQVELGKIAYSDELVDDGLWAVAVAPLLLLLVFSGRTRPRVRRRSMRWGASRTS